MESQVKKSKNNQYTINNQPLQNNYAETTPTVYRFQTDTIELDK